MPMTVVVTRDFEARYRGFLTSIMLEIAPGVYACARPVRRCARTAVDRAVVVVGHASPRSDRNGLARYKCVRKPSC